MKYRRASSIAESKVVLAAMMLFILPFQSAQISEAEDNVKQDDMRTRMNRWVGHSRADLLEGWGPPTNVIEDNGRQILVYDKSNTLLLPMGDSGPILPVKAERYVMFWLDEEGAIYKITWKGY